jgi:hypothetical protein
MVLITLPEDNLSKKVGTSQSVSSSTFQGCVGMYVTIYMYSVKGEVVPVLN